MADVDQVLMNPCLDHSVAYDRGVGYFTSTWLKRVASGVAGFAQNGGKMRLVTSPKLTPEDWAAIKVGTEAIENKILLDALKAEVRQLEQSAETKPVQTLSYMIAEGLLSIRIAVPSGKLSGDYHPKLGIFTDAKGDMLVFHGSQNETEQGRRNFESLDVFLSWADPRDASRARSHKERFDRIWSNSDPNVLCFDIPEAISKNIAQLYDPNFLTKTKPVFEGRWRHQDEAVCQFMKSCNGVLEMATGTGKTRTAQKIIERLADDNGLNLVLVTTRSLDLLEQWYTGFLGKKRWALFRHFGPHREASRFIGATGPKILFVAQSYLQDVLGGFSPQEVANALFVGDEVHGFGSPSMVRELSGKVSPFGYRLGLSATPERIYDAEGQAFIAQEIGPTIFEFTLEDAIRRGILCEFDYTALPYELSDEDKGAIRQAIRRHHARRAAGEASSDEALYRDLAAVRKTSRAKIPPFEQHLIERPDLYQRALIFVETREYGEEVQKRLLDAGIVFGTYYQGAEAYRLRDFAAGRLQCLVSCHRLSEGIDIQSVRNIVLFASARARLETIQRLGRCLRIDPANPEKRAHVLDFVDLISNDSIGKTADKERFDWFTSLSKVTRVEGE